MLCCSRWYPRREVSCADVVVTVVVGGGGIFAGLSSERPAPLVSACIVSFLFHSSSTWPKFVGASFAQLLGNHVLSTRHTPAYPRPFPPVISTRA